MSAMKNLLCKGLVVDCGKDYIGINDVFPGLHGDGKGSRHDVVNDPGVVLGHTIKRRKGSCIDDLV